MEIALWVYCWETNIVTIYLNMFKLISLLIFLTNPSSLNFKSDKINFARASFFLCDTLGYKNISGTWVLHDSGSFSLVEIKDSSNAHFTNYRDLEKSLNAKTKNRFTFINLDGKATIVNDSIFRIDFSDSWIWFKIKGDTLFEFGAMREDAMYFKMPDNGVKPLQ